jgi:hypothetical protein
MFTSVSGSDFRAITDITRTVTTIRTAIITARTMVVIIGLTTGGTGIGITGIIPIITGDSWIRIATPGWLESFLASPIF